MVDPFFHFFGGFIGEGDRKDAVAGDFVGVDEVGDAVGDDAGFARAGTGEDEEGAVDVGGGFALGGIEAFEKVHWIE